MDKREKIVPSCKIDSCFLCISYTNNDGDVVLLEPYCSETDNSFGEDFDGEIPEWCELEDA